MKRAPRIFGLAFGFLGLLATGTFLVGSMATCSADLAVTPDAEAGTCEPGPYVFCEAGAAAATGCIGDPPSGDDAGTANPGVGYPEGCIANFLDPVPDLRGECRVERSCTCVTKTTSDERPVPVPVETDAGDADAAAPVVVDAGSATKTATVLWQCTTR